MSKENTNQTTPSNAYGSFVTPEKFSEITGLSLDAVRMQIKRGKLPLLKRESSSDARRIFINMRAIDQLAEEQAAKYQDWRSAI
ncbi:hypothetical protein BCS71_24360 [Vibrio lentus]|uniref:hypothetical protein n=1 Tax=Vibrio TaxID=662 RepID=UPI0002EF2A97|nr:MULTISPECIES: hypothetical protein [Vibrio]OCH47245.1 hypothetical protein A6E08_01050 [Vibrio lentus]OED68616.1 hypothetical protein A165_02790 [Vibrio tasmaniensis ZS-17]PMI58017.1 hypothetical protein BCU41_04590 [Vibrio lentus]PMJ09780.1 hypothetical protein BCU31_01425 [Vibrio lentus]TKG16203.1 hypothetical protein FCW05_17295 [Vibrio lentus]